MTDEEVIVWLWHETVEEANENSQRCSTDDANHHNTAQNCDGAPGMEEGLKVKKQKFHGRARIRAWGRGGGVLPSILH